MTEDVDFYVALARESGGPVVELGVGTGRIAIPTAAAGVRVIGVDSSPGMLEVCRDEAERAGVGELLDLRLGDLQRPPVDERVPLVTCPFRAFLHLGDDGERLEALTAAHELLVPGGRFAFDVFEPDADDIAETNGRWLEREPGIFERADWDEEARTLTLSVAGRRRRVHADAVLDLPGRVARPASPGRLPGRGALRLVRPAPVRRRRGLDLDRAASWLIRPSCAQRTRSGMLDPWTTEWARLVLQALFDLRGDVSRIRELLEDDDEHGQEEENP